ncbi:MAG: 16S rRNA (uracil(1498)-N(3))-methyltransferase [Herbiconiux sp.]|uniref:16S rRNA (uracil(1498)-N(3))-methyltransferase n=1 Tax=Herbiconiux sp. TaxID=1871186 RepID=UPI0012195BAB|nr:16S rRNA (uracil(1498)-N(3))-methyltransferase [Herbiconiux sp.]TAJ49004.1 MAG: 16S rRNA (uracil(1498)-N(3))-methyltransferase [Herbiconiux sp.]
MSSLFLCDDLAASPHDRGDVVRLTGDEARHAATVNRMRVGEHTAIGDGRGVIVRGIVTRVDARELELVVETVERHAEVRLAIVLVQALAKGDRDEMAIQAATELGVSGVVPWQAERSVSRWAGPKIAKGVERWSSIVREAAKQSIRPFVPEVGDLADTAALVRLAADVRMLVLEPSAEQRLTALTFTTPTHEATETPIVLVVGPEGGISPRELTLLTGAGATPVRLGDEVLRTSTAGPAALAVLNAALGRW